MGVVNKVLLAIAVCFALVAVSRGQTQQPAPAATAPDPELVSLLSNQLHISSAQATGGAGAIFGLVKSKVSPEQFSQIASAVPGMDGFVKAAPAAESAPAQQNSSQGVSSSLGSVASMAPGSAGGLASLASSFQSLGLSPSMVNKFAPIIQNYLGSKGGTGAASAFAGALK